MRITRGDNFGFFFLTGLTLVALAGTFVAGKIYSVMNPIVITINNTTDSKIENLSISCSRSIENISIDGNDKSELKFAECSGEIKFSIGEVPIGSCTSEESGFSKLDIEIKEPKVSQVNCKFEL